MEILHKAPEVTDFVPLVEHQSTTPASFYNGPPVLHYFSDKCKVLILDNDLSSVPALAGFVRSSSKEISTNGTSVSHPGSDGDQIQRIIENVDIWVTSDKLLLFSNSTSAGVSIPYPTISLHAIQSLPRPTPGEQQGLYMQLISLQPDSEEDAEPDSVSITLIPTAFAPPSSLHVELPTDGIAPTSEDPDMTEREPEQAPVVALFTALSDCSNLHPDPVEEGDDEDGISRLMQAGLVIPGDASGGLPPAMPGSGGWITAENMHEFFDEDGNYIGPDDDDEAGAEQNLGPGAGTVRARDDDMGIEDDHNATEETKWQRTG